MILGTYGPHDETNALFYEWRVYKNVGTAEKYQFNAWETIVDSVGKAILASTLVIKDLDRDGKKDLIFSYERDIPFAWYRNVGTAPKPEFHTYEELTIPEGGPLDFSFYDLADITGDGVLDLLFVDMYYPKYCKGVLETSIQDTKSKMIEKESSLTIQSGQIEVLLQKELKGPCLIKLYDVKGCLLYSLPLKGKTIQIPDIPRGWYIVSLEFNGLCEHHLIVF